MKPTNPLFTGIKTTIFEHMSVLAREHSAINLGQGFPDADGPTEMLEAAGKKLASGPNQYPPMLGVPELRAAVAAHNKRFYDLDVDPASEVLVTSGATEALADSLMALVEPGDEVILIEPLYDCYLPLVQRAGGIPRRVRLSAPDWQLDLQALAEAFNENTKAILINNPMNPVGKVFSQTELNVLSQLIVENDCYAICDEVYEHITFDGHRHIPLMSLPGMRDRTVRIGSAGKTFSMTGWKVGYITAAPHLLDPIAKAHQFVTFTTPPHLQAAVAHGLQMPSEYFTKLAQDLSEKRDLLAAGLTKLGFSLSPCDGTYFLTCDVRPLGLVAEQAEANEASDVALCEKMVKEAGVAAVPLSAFYVSDAPSSHIRFCICKSKPLLEEALERLSAWPALRSLKTLQENET
ncbi:aminotransferase [Polycladidibacter hongkongensis]|uniref:aminotransferase n=1 Tax=Polycladidibacter hongkongensis TaxID=1647556 RepID=UPI0008369B06|nr:aminotransferase [Pseudovibrio hongkongensis]